MHRLIALALLLVGLAAVPVIGPVRAQDQQRIVALVNDEVVSQRDLNERMRIILATTRLPDNNPEILRAVREQALRSLIDDRLQMQEAKKRGISMSQQDLDTAIAAVERQMNIPPGRFDEFMHRGGIDPSAVTSQIRTELTWGRMVRGRTGAQACVEVPDARLRRGRRGRRSGRGAWFWRRRRRLWRGRRAGLQAERSHERECGDHLFAALPGELACGRRCGGLDGREAPSKPIARG